MYLTKTKTLILALTSLLTPALGGASDTYKLDKSHTTVEFVVSHMVISNVRGQFLDFDGTIELDEKKLSRSTVSAVAKVASIDTRDPKRDKHLRSSDFFDAERFPEIKFTLESLRGKAPNLKARGTLQIRDVQKEVEFDVDYRGTAKDPWGNTRLGFGATTTIDRRDYGITWNKALDAGGLLVGNNVQIVLEVEGVKQ